MDGLFPHFMEDYERTTGKKIVSEIQTEANQ